MDYNGGFHLKWSRVLEILGSLLVLFVAVVIWVLLYGD